MMIKIVMALQSHFENVKQIILQGPTDAIQAAHFEQLKDYWNAVAYVHQKPDAASWV